MLIVTVLGSLLLAREVLGLGGEVLWEDQYDSLDQSVVWSLDEGSGRVVAAGQVSDLTGANERFLVRAYAAATGALLWTHLDDASVLSGALDVRLRGVRAYVAGYVSDRFFPMRTFFLVRSYDARTGQILWEDRHDVATNTPGDTGFAQAIAVGGQQVFAAGNFHSAFGPFRGGMLIRAYDKFSGALLWEAQHLNEGFGSSLERSLIVASNRVFVAATRADSGGTRGFIRAYDSATGAVVWEDVYPDADYGITTGIVAGGSRVFVSGLEVEGNGSGRVDLTVRAYDSASGQLLWRNRRSEMDTDHVSFAITTSGGFVFTAGHMYSGVGTDSSIVRAIDARTGVLVWEDLPGSDRESPT